jgi:hypothetical protein
MNRQLTGREKLLVRYAGIGIAIYLALFGGYYVWKFFDKQRAAYVKLGQEARDLRQQTLPYQDKALLVKKLMDDFHLDPAKLKRETVVSDASAAIQNAAKSGGFGLGPIHESPAHGSGLTLATIQLEGTGPVPAALTFLASLNTIGFPVVVDSVQFTADNSRPGQVKMNLTILILDFDQQKEAKETKEAPHA